MQSTDRDAHRGNPLMARLRMNGRIFLGAVTPPGRYSISYPKSGRTWLRAMIGHVLCGRTRQPLSALLNSRRLTAAAGLETLKWHHGGASLKRPCPRHDELVFDPRFTGKPVVFVMRDPRDTLVSSYFEVTKRTASATGGPGLIDAFVRSPDRGILKWIAFHNLWHANLANLASFHLVRYETLHAEPLAALRGVLVAIGLDDVTDDELARAVEFARFENLKRLESGGLVQAAALRPADTSDPDSYKVRKGRVGGYRESLAAEDIAFIEDTLRRTPCPLYRENYPSQGVELSPKAS